MFDEVASCTRTTLCLFCFRPTRPSNYDTKGRMSWKAFLSRNLQSIKFIACPNSASSEGVRTYWAANYAEVKHLNPRFPFMIRSNPDADPYMLVEYGSFEVEQPDSVFFVLH